jgi:glutamate 5-kinase
MASTERFEIGVIDIGGDQATGQANRVPDDDSMKQVGEGVRKRRHAGFQVIMVEFGAATVLALVWLHGFIFLS